MKRECSKEGKKNVWILRSIGYNTVSDTLLPQKGEYLIWSFNYHVKEHDGESVLIIPEIKNFSRSSRLVKYNCVHSKWREMGLGIVRTKKWNYWTEMFREARRRGRFYRGSLTRTATSVVFLIGLFFSFVPKVSLLMCRDDVNRDKL